MHNEILYSVAKISREYDSNSGFTTNGLRAEKISGLFLLGFFFIYIKGFLSATTILEIPDYVDNILLLFGIEFLLLHFILNIRSLGRNSFIYTIVLFLMALCYFLSSDSTPFFAVLTIITAVSVYDTKRMIKIWFGITLSLIVLLLFVYLLNMMFDPNSIEVFYRYNNSTVTLRYAFYFNHPNFAAAYLMILSAIGLYFRFERLRFVDCFIVELVAVFIIFFVDSRTSGYLTATLPLLFFLQKKYDLFTRGFVLKIVRWLPTIFFVATFLLAGPLYSDSVGSWFTGRVWLWHVCYEHQGFSIFGQPFQAVFAKGYDGFYWNAKTLDSFYASGLFVSGILFSSLFSWSFYKRCKINDVALKAEIPVLILVAIFGFTEGHVLDFALGFPMLFWLKAVVKPSLINDK